MQRALDLARRGWGRVAPNPLVGAVVLSGDAVVGEGYHAEYGGPHAEVVALQAAGERARGATLVVNLEPCAHHGKTPPCTDAIVKAGVTKVVAALSDPDPEARGGAGVLRGKGVTVSIGLLAEAAAALNAPFLFAREQRERPWVALKLATSIDGRIADAAGSSQWVSGEAAREYVHWLRAGFDAIAVGGTTALQDNPRLTVRGPVTPRRPPVRVVFDRRAMLNPSTLLVSGAREVPTWVMSSLEAPVSSVTALEQNGVRVFRPDSLASGLRMLRDAGIESVLCEGGGALGARLLTDGLVDRLYWVQAPVWLGEGAVPAFPGVPPQPLAAAPRWTPVERRVLGSDTLLVLDRRICLPES
ncbi:MAG TPA: bifunctional diaminohydroxyphosphoribosylaminopyrimidine deaminase/5-amino-6-(5-phosphoribosylamino)uracil reductase RibD [Gemmatimonadales bacterium]|jgi:diaminohydroxyphosphoribosylaminopyrimidine deaminase / 5-amino-6-(5-phosphoribosylamino)uracil reductase|nr:bifunctional diaminohydroxyphosphoribosylaminopyrimidine deaminase/5-amino-6-(5-phosphoribosylamino)uracil reductase RibD [Gemmatimonadales bacterium]